MNKTVILMRHGEAGTALRDFDRPLVEKGIEKCQSQGGILRHHNVVLSALVSSSAVRALSSAIAVAKAMHYAEDKIMTEDKLYNASVDTVLEIIKNFDDAWHTVLLLGHNPSFSFLSRALCPQIGGDLGLGEFYAISFPLLHWSDIMMAEGEWITYA